MSEKAVVLMSTYNGEKYVEEQILSILRQKDVDVELIIRDDGSKDNTVQILNKMKKNNCDKIKIMEEVNVGVAKSFFHLCQCAPDSDYYFFADQDDYWEEDKISVAINKIKTIPTDIPALYVSAVEIVNKDLEKIRIKTKTNYKMQFGNVLMESVAQGCTFCFNKALLKVYLNLSPEDLDIHDWMLYRVAGAINATVFYDTTPHILYRQHEGNAIGANDRKAEWKRRAKKFVKGNYKRVRSDAAAILLMRIKKYMPKENIELCEIVTKSRTNFSYRLKAIFNGKLIMENSIDTFILKFALLIGAV